MARHVKWLEMNNQNCKCCPYKESTEIPTRSIHDTWNHWILTESASTVEIASNCKKEVASRPSSSNHRNWWAGSGVGGGQGGAKKHKKSWWEPMLWSSCWIFWRFWNVLIMCNVSAESSWQFQWRSNHVNSSWLLSMFFLGFKALVPSLSVQNRLQQDEGWRNTWWIFSIFFWKNSHSSSVPNINPIRAFLQNQFLLYVLGRSNVKHPKHQQLACHSSTKHWPYVKMSDIESGSERDWENDLFDDVWCK